MPPTNPKCFHLSASSIAAVKACPNRFRLAYREGLRVERDTDSQRCGTNWHAMHEEYANALADFDAPHYAMDRVVSLLNERYANVPSWIDAQAWALERQVLLTSFVGYLWYWQNDPVEFLASEVPFNLPLHEPKTGMPCSMESVQRVGKIDHIVKWQDAVCNLERKSTTRSIAPDSDYWQKSKMDTQVSMYALAFQDMRKAGLMDGVLYGDNEQRAEGQTIPAASGASAGPQQGVENGSIEEGEAVDLVCETEGVQPVSGEAEAVSAISSPRSGNEEFHRGVSEGHPESSDDVDGNPEVRSSVCQLPLVPSRGRETLRFGSTLYDVWHKPTIKPCMLTQAETKAFIESGEYCGQKFVVTYGATGIPHVDGYACEVEQGKKADAWRENIPMFGARLLQNIYERPDFYYARREIARTADEIREFRGELFAIYQAQQAFSRHGFWFSNESACRATFPCSYIPICFGPGARSVCDGKTTPPGFKRIFVDLTINGKEVEE